MAFDPRQNIGGQNVGGQNTAGSSRPVDLAGDSAELVAFALLRYLAQVEQQLTGANRPTFDRKWMLDAYSECLEAVRGERKISGTAPAGGSGSAPAGGSGTSRKRAAR